jgi:hypothetical protein
VVVFDMILPAWLTFLSSIAGTIVLYFVLTINAHYDVGTSMLIASLFEMAHGGLMWVLPGYIQSFFK